MYGQDPWPAGGHANRLGAGMPKSSRPPGADSRNSAVVVAEVSHRSSPTQRRERFHLGPERAAALARALANEGREAVVLATCTRTEIYLTGTDAAETGLRAACALAEVGGCAVDPETVAVRSNEAAACHLFRVAAGLESIVLGDTHVAAQVRQAHTAAKDAGATGPLLDRLFESASGASKRVRSQTAVSSGATSIPALAVATAACIAAPLAERRVLIVGAGRMARVAALSAWSRGCHDIAVVNRTPARANELADRVGGRAAPLDRLAAELAAANVVITATRSHGFVVTEEHLEAGRPIAIFDLALPRDVHPAFRAVTRLYSLDDLASTVQATSARRRGELELAGAIAGEEASRYESWRRVRSVAPSIVALRGAAERSRREVLERHAGELAGLTASERELVDTLTRRLVSNLAHESTVELRRQTLTGRA